MAFILNIETATALCSVALSVDGNVIALRETLEEKSHASMLTAFVEELLKEKNLSISDLDAVAVGKGPGSYTGLRIGVSAAKGLCYGANIGLIAVNTLTVLFQSALLSLKGDFKKDALFCPMIDARRMEVFTCLYNSSANELEPVTAKIVDGDSFRIWLDQNEIYFFGSGMEKCRTVLTHKNAHFIDRIFPHANALAQLADLKYSNNEFEDLAYFEPFYLKDFIATVPKKGIHF
ncbi:MAG TPA: tRNA (adenosine(37)-N6)-threonylcarbamoyltransferase complex dimerization subunit type 1 TsaB [Bacteroidales bacterium]|nr:tRNA (adenosine(37)-N6)-threonylcarbamoyltransferase complex dimerization subunit type 1 TsaB [Bacteroidales bacterium]